PDQSSIALAMGSGYELSENLSNQEIALLFNAICKVEGLDPKVVGVLVEQIKVLAIKLHDLE
ncbi:hypothetical protein, partial [Citrobacter freundii]|uniref:hypothetical protein n=1 Tax=Citrobacter freundii TaxID=546 RepID=UPI0013D04E0A